MQNNITVHTDGGSRGNPGPAASGFFIELNGSEIFRGSDYLGKQTNNFAEYTAVINALKWLNSISIVDLKESAVLFLLDSELVVKQINGLYKIKDENLKKLHNEVVNQILQTGVKITFRHIPREQNKVADFLVNQELDKRL